MDWRNWREWLTGSGGNSGIVLTRSRIRAAYAIAIAVDALEFVLGPVGWAFSDEILDVVALIATTKLLGFHPLLLPTFILEMLPVMDMLPTWTGCVALVVALRKKQRPQTGDAGAHTVTIDVKPTSVT
jgi:hypothetical protein